MKIFIVTQTFPPKFGGMQAVMKSLAEELNNFYKIIVLPNHYLTKEIKLRKKITIFNSFLPKILKPFYKKMVISFLGEEEDIFICDSWKSLNAIPKKIKNNIYVLAHGQEYLKEKNSQKIKKYLKRVRGCISNSNYTKELSSKFTGANTRHFVIHPTYMLPNSIFKKIYKKEDELKFITISRLETRKGLMESLQVFNDIHKSYPRLKFTWNIIGNGPLLDTMKTYVHNNQLNKIIKFHGYLNEKDKNKFLEESNIFIMPSYHHKNSVEGFGIVYAEAARYGLPSIAGIDGGVIDAVNKNNGWNINPRDTKKFKSLILILLKDHRKVFSKGINAQQIYQTKFSKKNSLADLIKVINS